MSFQRSASRLLRSVPTETAPDDDSRAEPARDALLGASAAMGRLREMIARVARSTRPVLVTGPTGSGKEQVVRALHAKGPHPDAPLLDINCGAIPETLIESYLFGHERGAFTGADRRQEGYLAAVGQGTLFLDEVVELPLVQQARLLRVLETGRFRPLGSHAEQTFRGRVVAATHADVEGRVARKTFREDLYYRLNVLTVRVPALAEHPDDIPDLVAHFVARSGRALRFTPEALTALKSRAWPGNVRELRNLVDRLAVFDDDVITPEVLCAMTSSERAAPSEDLSLDQMTDAILDMEASDKIDALIEALVGNAMRRADGNKSAAARILGMHRKALDRRLARSRRSRPKPALPRW